MAHCSIIPYDRKECKCLIIKILQNKSYIPETDYIIPAIIHLKTK